MTEKEPGRADQDEETLPKNPLYGKFYEVNQALVSTPKTEVRYRRPLPEDEETESEEAV